MGILPDDFQKRIKLSKESGLDKQYGQYNNQEDYTKALENWVTGNTGGSSSSSNKNKSNSSSAPKLDLQSLYDTSMNSPEITGLQGEIDAKKAALNEALTGINDNPFYSEATRTGKIAKLNDQAQRDIGLVQEQLSLKQADAQTKINIATQQYNIDSQEYQNNLTRLNTLISSGALLGASGNDIAQIAQATGMSTAMVKSIQKNMESANNNPQVVTDTDDSGNVTVSVINGNTGEVIGQNSLGAVGKATKSSSGSGAKPNSTEVLQPQMNAILQTKVGGDGFISPTDWNKNLRAWLAEGGKQDEFVSLFNNYVNATHSEDYFGYDKLFSE